MLGDFGAVGRTLERLEEVITPPVGHLDESYYAWSPYPMGLFLEGLHEAMRYLSARDQWTGMRTFLDVGCGIGTKMAVAAYMGWRVKGIELYPEYAQVCRRVCPTAPVAVTNAFEWTDYDADLVYSYRLCGGDDDQERLVAHIVAHMRPGALLFLAGSCPDPAGAKLIGSSVWRVG